MPAAVRDTQTCTRAIRSGGPLDEHYQGLSHVDQADRGVRALTAIARRCQLTRTQPRLGEPHGRNRASGMRTDAVRNAPQQPSAPGHPRRVMWRITAPEVTRC